MISTYDHVYKVVVKLCRVCGDHASGFNFNGLVCESCKAFFRRNAVKNKVFKCAQRNENCLINQVNRKRCKKCRLQKCYTIGMKKELILSFKIELEEKQRNSNENYLDATKDVSKIMQVNLQIKNQLKLNRLQPYDLVLIREVKNARLCFRDVTKLELISQVDTLIEALNLAEHYVLKVVQFCKHFNAFKYLNLNDQMIMLKAFFPEIGAIGAAFLYSSERDGLPVIADKTENKAVFVKLDFTAVFKRKEIVKTLRRFINEMKLEMEDDETIRDLILAQLLFTPRENVIAREYIKFNHTVYCHLLRRYLQFKYGNELRAEKKYVSLSKTLNQISEVSQIICEVYRNEVDAIKVATVLAEIYDLI